MSTLYVEEFESLMVANRDALAVGRQPSLARQAISFTATPGQSAAFDKRTRFVRLHTDGICSYKFGDNPTATANSDPRMVAGATEYFGVEPGGNMKVSAVTST